MALKWTKEDSPTWNADKQRIVGAAPEGVFDMPERDAGDVVPCEWWRVERDGRVVGYGWLDNSWGDAEILLAVDPAECGAGIGTFILDRLEDEARAQGLNYLYNVVRETHPEGARVSAWLEARGFHPSGENQRLLKRAVPGSPKRG